MTLRRPILQSSLIVFILLCIITPLTAETFQFKYRKGEKYRILSTVNEELYINGIYSHSSDIMNKIVIEVEDVRDGAGLLDSTFVFTDRVLGGAYVVNEEYASLFWRDRSGYYSMDDGYYMPVVRNVPLFPDSDLKPGDSWAAEGYEVHDFRAAFGIETAYRFPINVRYKYLGSGELDGQTYSLISADYTVFYRPPATYSIYDTYPVRISGFSSSVLYWDSDKGRVCGVSEEFELIFDISNGQSFNWRGTAEGRVIESSDMDKDLVAEDIRDRIREEGISDADVIVEDSGVTIVLQNIQFYADSFVLAPSEKGKLDGIIDILELYPKRDILITGHTAFAGTAEGRQHLSEERARAVADYLLQGSGRNAEQMTILGMGARDPVSDNSSEQGMSSNRRVEITILEN